MPKMIETTVLKPHLAPSGRIVQVGEVISVDETRHRALVKKGYVPRPATEEVSETAPQAKEGITNADFEPRRETIVGEKPTEAVGEENAAETDEKAADGVDADGKAKKPKAATATE